MSIKRRLERLENRVSPPAEPSIFGGLLEACTVDELTAMIEHLDQLPYRDPFEDSFMAAILARAAARGDDHEHQTTP